MSIPDEPQEQACTVKGMIVRIADIMAYLNHDRLLEQQLAEMSMSQCNPADRPKERIICDLIASMTDQRVMELYKKNFFPSPLVSS